MTAVIIEDETVAVNNLKAILSRNTVASIRVVAELESIEESVNYFSHMKHPDLIFADIHLADGTAFKIFDKVRVNAPVIFTTAYEEYAIKAFQLNSIDYLLKPITQDALNAALQKYLMLKKLAPDKDAFPDPFGAYFERLYGAIDQVRREIGKEPTDQPLFVKEGNKIVRVNQSDILYLEGYGDYVKIHHTGGKVLLSQVSLKRFESSLDDRRFCRVHRSYIVAIPHISYIERKRIRMGNDLIPVSDSYYPRLLDQLALRE